MAKYIVTRTSIWGNEKPIEDAVPCTIHKFVQVSGKATGLFRKELRVKILVTKELEDGGFEGYLPTEVYVCDVSDLQKFVRQYGKIVLLPPNNKEGYFEIEIYDDYRE